MKIAILEIAPHGHYTYVESIAKIYTAVAENQVVIFTHERGQKALQHIENEQISLNIWHSNSGNTEGVHSFLSGIIGFDKLFVVTLEAHFKDPFRIMQVFEKVDFKCPIYYVIHNLDFWFDFNFSNKIRNVFHQLDSFKSFIYRLKVYFYYASINAKIVEKVKQSNGFFVSLTSTVGAELARYVSAERVKVIPFSVFEDKIADKSGDNSHFRVCLPGYVSASRRDYASIFKILANDTEGVVKHNIAFDFLGGIAAAAEGGEAIRNEANNWIKKGYTLHIYDKPSVGLTEFDDNLAKADIVLGNLILKQGATSSYGKLKESGLVFTMIKAAKIGLVPSDYPLEPALKSSVLTFRTYEEAIDILLRLRQNPDELARLKAAALENARKFTPLSILEKLK
jgi:hypothetical protein